MVELTSPTIPMPRARCSTISRLGTGIRSCSSSLGYRWRCSRRWCARRQSSGKPTPCHLGYALPIAGLAGDQQAALFGQGCVSPGLAKNTYGTGAFLLVLAGERVPSPPAGILATAACGARGEPAYALEGSVFIAGAAIQWLRDGLGLLPTRRRVRPQPAAVPDTGGVHFVPAFVGLGTPYWEPECPGNHHRADPGDHPAASGSRRARSDGVQQRGTADAMARRSI